MGGTATVDGFITEESDRGGIIEGIKERENRGER
jgi:hypothetical protein